MFYDAETIEDVDAVIGTLSWHTEPCPVCGRHVGGEAILNPDTGQVYHPACVGVEVPQPQPIEWCKCDAVGVGACPTCGGEMYPF